MIEIDPHFPTNSTLILNTWLGASPGIQLPFLEFVLGQFEIILI